MRNTDLALSIDRFMRRIHFGLQSKAHAFDTAKVGPGGGIVLLTLSDMGSPGLGELTTRVARDKSQMTRTVRSLEAKGLVERYACTDDARVTRIRLTAEGDGVVATLQNAVAETIDDILAPVSEEEKGALKRILERALVETDPQ
ncbi:MAG: MarR family transcriptional regulator [Pseudomonadota bacterium]